MSDIINKLLLARDKFMPEIHLRQRKKQRNLQNIFTEMN